MYRSIESDLRYACERHTEYLAAARIQRLIRQAQSDQQSAARPSDEDTVLARLFEALWSRQAVRA